MRVLALVALAVAVAAVSVEVRLSKTALKLGTCPSSKGLGGPRAPLCARVVGVGAAATPWKVVPCGHFLSRGHLPP